MAENNPNVQIPFEAKVYYCRNFFTCCRDIQGFIGDAYTKKHTTVDISNSWLVVCCIYVEWTDLYVI